MSNNLHADILYDYLVEGFSQQDIANNYGITQSEVSKIIRERYGLNKGNKKWGKGSTNQLGQYPDLSYDDICDFIASGSKDLDGWLNGDGYDDDGYDDDYDDDGCDDSCDDDYEDADENYNGGYQNNTYSGSGSQSNNQSYSQPYNQSYNHPQPTNRKTVRYVNPDDYDDNGNYRRSGLSIDARVFMLILGVVIFGAGWLVSKLGNTTGTFGLYLQILWHSNFLWWGIVTGGIFGFLKYSSCRNLGEVLTTCGTWAWMGAGYVIGGIVFYVKYAYLIPALMLAALGVIIGFIGYKLFY